MESGKAVILNAVSKFRDSDFRPRDISFRTGLRPQLINHHLKVMVEKGWLKKDGFRYEVVNLDEIIDALTEASEPNDKHKPPVAQGIITDEFARYFGRQLTQIIMLKSLHSSQGFNSAAYLNEQIDKTITFYKQAKRYLNNHSPAESTALKNSREEELKKLYDALTKWGYNSGLTYDEWQNQITELKDAIIVRRMEEANE